MMKEDKEQIIPPEDRDLKFVPPTKIYTKKVNHFWNTH